MIVSASSSVARSVTGTIACSPRKVLTAHRTRHGILIDIDRDASGCSEPTAVDDGVADRHVAVLAGRWRVDTVDISGRRLDVDDRSARTECGEVNGDRLLVSRVEETVVGDRRRLRTRAHGDPQHRIAGEFAIADLVVHHRSARRTRRGGECDRSVRGDRRRTQRRDQGCVIVTASWSPSASVSLDSTAVVTLPPLTTSAKSSRASGGRLSGGSTVSRMFAAAVRPAPSRIV